MFYQWHLHRKTTVASALFGGLLACQICCVFGQVKSGPPYCQWHAGSSQTAINQAVGPVFFRAKADQKLQWVLRPIVCCDFDRGYESYEVDVLYPVFTYDRRGLQYRWQLLQLLSASDGTTASGTNFDRFTVFPIFFTQRSADAAQGYTALFPVAGTLKNRFFRDEIQFILWPLYVKTVRTQPAQAADLTQLTARVDAQAQVTEDKVVTHNFVAPVVHVRSGPGLNGWQVWPLIGFERKLVTAHTNLWGETEVVPGHESRFFLWPLWLQNTRNIGTTNVERHVAFLPFFAQLRSANRDSTSYLWPIGLTITDDRTRKYREMGAPWPFIVFASGEGKSTRRIFPVFSQARSATAESEWYLWPIYKRTRLHAQTLERDRTRILFFLFSDTIERNTQADVARRRTALWPLFTATRSYDGVERFQLFSVLEPILPNNTAIERNYSAFWTIWRSEKNPVAGLTNQSLLWNLFRRDASANSRKSSFMFGLFQHEVTDKQKRLRMFFIPVSKRPTSGANFRWLETDFTTNIVQNTTARTGL